MPVRLSCVLFLNSARVRQHHPAQFLRARGAKDPAAIPIGAQARQISHVVEMSMRQDDSIDLPRRNRELFPIADSEFFESLKQSAIHEHPLPVVLEQILRPGHRTGGAHKR